MMLCCTIHKQREWQCLTEQDTAAGAAAVRRQAQNDHTLQHAALLLLGPSSPEAPKDVLEMKYCFADHAEGLDKQSDKIGFSHR